MYPDGERNLPCILIASAWEGRNKFSCEHADRLAKKGYACFALDVYGKAKLGNSYEENEKLMLPLLQDRSELLIRLKAGFETVKNFNMVNAKKMAAIGFCFGGLCVLDMARQGLDLKAIVSFHGLLAKPNYIPNKIK